MSFELVFGSFSTKRKQTKINKIFPGKLQQILNTTAIGP
jgi:hypothetical protein